MSALLPGILALAIAGVGVVEWRWIAARSRWLGLIFAAGVILRLAASAALFAISYYDLNVARGLHTGGGYWTLAADAQLYFPLAAHAARGALAEALLQPMSPGYVTALAVWMRAAGISMLSAILFNTVCYMAMVAAIVAGARRANEETGASTWVLAAFSFSPMLLLSSTQVLKEAFFLMLIAVAARGAFRLLAEFGRASSRRRLVMVTTASVLAYAMIAGVRWYYAAFVWIATAAGILALVLASSAHPAITRARVMLRGAIVLVALGIACLLGSGVREAATKPLLATDGVTTAIETGRAAFIKTGGATNLVKRAPPALASPELIRLTGMPDSEAFDIGPFKAFILTVEEQTPLAGPDLRGALEPAMQNVKTAYFLRGWDPRDTPGSPSPARQTVAAALSSHQVAVSELPVDADAAALDGLLIVAGDRRDLSPNELAVTAAFLTRGGRMLRVIDPGEPLSTPAPPLVDYLASAGQVALQVGTGLAAIFVPMSLLRAASIVDIDGGRGMIFVADIDTIFLDASLVWLGLYVWRRRAQAGVNVAGLVFAVTLTAISAVLLAYVVTNFGTLLRLRLLIAAPAWLAPLALAGGVRERVCASNSAPDPANAGW